MDFLRLVSSNFNFRKAFHFSGKLGLEKQNIGKISDPKKVRKYLSDLSENSNDTFLSILDDFDHFNKLLCFLNPRFEFFLMVLAFYQLHTLCRP